MRVVTFASYSLFSDRNEDTFFRILCHLTKNARKKTNQGRLPLDPASRRTSDVRRGFLYSKNGSPLCQYFDTRVASFWLRYFLRKSKPVGGAAAVRRVSSLEKKQYLFQLHTDEDDK